MLFHQTFKTTLYYVIAQRIWRAATATHIPVQLFQTCALEGGRIHECHGRSACSVPAEDTQHKNTCNLCRLSMANSTSTTLSNMCARGRKEMCTSVLVGFRKPWTTTLTGGGGGDTREKTIKQKARRTRNDNKKASKRVNLSQTGVWDFIVVSLSATFTIHVIRMQTRRFGQWCEKRGRMFSAVFSRV